MHVDTAVHLVDIWIVVCLDQWLHPCKIQYESMYLNGGKKHVFKCRDKILK